MLQQQALSVQQLGNDLQVVRDERQLTDLAQASDAAIVDGQWGLARSLLADNVTVDVTDQVNSAPVATTADAFIAQLQNTLARGGVLPRSNPTVHLNNNRAVLTSAGYSWRLSSRAKSLSSQKIGTYEYSFDRTVTGWRIDGLVFRHPGA